MKFIKVVTIATVSAVLIVSCTITEPEGVEANPAALQQEITITASFGEPDTRTVREADGSVLWSPGDEISVFYGSGTDGGSKFTSQNTEKAKVANFSGTVDIITGGNDVSVEDTYFWATYPYCSESSCDGTSITTVLPSTQMAVADTFADDLFPAIGRSQGMNMGFYNICGGLKFTVSEEGIKSVTLKGNSGEQLAGKITVGFGENGLPVVSNIADGSDSIVLSAPEGETMEVGKAYFMVFVPTVFENGFTLTFSKGYARAVKERTTKTTIRRSVFGTMNTPDAGPEWEMLYVPIPDANFKSYMIQNFDTNGNGELDFDEAEAVKSIYVITDDIESLEGIAFCKNLQKLYCYGTKAPYNETEYRHVSSGRLASLDVSANTALTDLRCYCNQLTNLDVSKNTELSILRCFFNQLTGLDLSANTVLTELWCENNQLTSLDVSENTALTRLYCSSNLLTSLDMSNNTALTDLSCYFNKLTSLDVSKNTALTSLSCYGNNLTNIDVKNNVLLIHLYCYSNQLSVLDISTNTELTELLCGCNQLTSLDVSRNIALTRLECASNKLTALDVSKNTALTNLQCDSNQLTTLDVSMNKSLAELKCDFNKLTSLNVSENTALTYLDCSPMKDKNCNNYLEYLYIAEGQQIPNVTTNRSSTYIPDGTSILVSPGAGGSESTGEENLD